MEQRDLSCVFAYMYHHIRFSTKWIGTMRALIGVFPCMNSNMRLQIIFSAKWMATVGTFIGFFSCMSYNMLLQTAKPRKGFKTFSPTVGFSPVWIRIWFWGPDALVKVTEHSGQVNWFTSVCLSKWLWRPVFLANISEHTEQPYGSSNVCTSISKGLGTVATPLNIFSALGIPSVLKITRNYVFKKRIAKFKTGIKKNLQGMKKRSSTDHYGLRTKSAHFLYF